MTLADVIEVVSEYKVGSSDSDDISDTQLSMLVSITSSRVSRLNPGFTGGELELFTAYIILDSWENRNPQITEKTVKDTRWKVHDLGTTSRWLDLAYQMIAEYTDKSILNVAGVARSDSEMKGLDSTTITQWGDYSGSL